MREIRQSGSEGGVADNGHPYPYTSPGCNPGYGCVEGLRSVGTPHRASPRRAAASVSFSAWAAAGVAGAAGAFGTAGAAGAHGVLIA